MTFLPNTPTYRAKGSSLASNMLATWCAIFHHGHPAPTGVVLFRLAGPSPADDNRRMIEVLDRLDECIGRFTTVTDRLIRSKAFPKS